MNYIVTEIDNGWLLRCDKGQPESFTYFKDLSELPTLVAVLGKKIKEKCAAEGKK